MLTLGETDAGRIGQAYRAGQNSSLARCAAELGHLAPKAGLAAMPCAQPGHEGLVRLEPAVIADAGLQCPAFEQVPGRVPVTLGLGALQRSVLVVAI